MGCFNVCCSISHLSINAGDKIKFFPLTPSHNEPFPIQTAAFGERNCFFNPATFPITGYYDEYGGITSIEKDENVLAIEAYFQCSIETFICRITSHHEDSDLSGMFVLDSIYQTLVEFALADKTRYEGCVTPDLLPLFGFKEVSKEEQYFIDPHHRRRFVNETHGYDLFLGDYGAALVPSSEMRYVVMDHRGIKDLKHQWTFLTKEPLSTFPIEENSSLSSQEQFEQIKAYLKTTFGYHVGFSEHEDSATLYDIPTFLNLWQERTGESINLDFLKSEYTYDYQLERAIERLDEFEAVAHLDLFSISNQLRLSHWTFLETLYQEKLLQGSFRKELREHRAFELAMYQCNCFYFPAMNGEQWGNSTASKVLLDASLTLINQRLAEEQWDELND